MAEAIIFSLMIFYKVVSLIVGLAFAHMGYRLFLAEKEKSAGNLDVRGRGCLLKLTGGAPGTFFALFGMVIVAFAVFKGISYVHEPSQIPTPPAILLPDKPPV